MEYDVLIFAVLTAGAVLIINQLGRMVRTSMLHKTIRRAISADNAAVPALLSGIEEKPAPSSDDRTGLVLLALGIATILFGAIQGDSDDIRNMAGIAMFPILVGAALLGRFWYSKRSGR
jgi:ABC-type transport system involved in cytochrome c biogenesis permease subunit